MSTDGSPIAHEELEARLAQHDRYVVSEGREGELLDLCGVVVEDFDFAGHDLTDVMARGGSFLRCRFVAGELSGLDFSNAKIPDCDFSEAVLNKANLARADAKGARFDGANMVRAEMIRADLEGASLRGASLRGATMTRANLNGAVLDGADLTRANLSQASLEGASLEGAIGAPAPKPVR